MTTTDYPQFTVSRRVRVRAWRSYLRLPASKRLIDLSVCILLLPLCLALSALVAVLIVVDSSGSPLFVQERVGIGGKRFRVYKFRTMVTRRNDGEERDFMQKFVSGQLIDESNQLHKPIKKSDITRLGRLLRKSSLDELPQVINILRGEMSLVGPRPNVPWEVEAYKPWHYERLNALPGITGLAQVMGRSSLSFDQIARFDIQYVRNQSIGMDIRILYQTFQTVLSARGAG